MLVWSCKSDERVGSLKVVESMKAFWENMVSAWRMNGNSKRKLILSLLRVIVHITKTRAR